MKIWNSVKKVDLEKQCEKSPKLSHFFYQKLQTYLIYGDFWR